MFQGISQYMAFIDTTKAMAQQIPQQDDFSCFIEFMQEGVYPVMFEQVVINVLVTFFPHMLGSQFI